jgi:hypothetical protein
MAALTALFILRLFLQEAEGIFDGEESGVLDLGRPNTPSPCKIIIFFFYNKQRKITEEESKNERHSPTVIT